jgi:L-threonylcarbamoyladenylate synthase
MRAIVATHVAATHTPVLFSAAVEQASHLLKTGELVALPTETVYGLAANALNPDAVARIFSVKGRPPHNPIIVHVASLESARLCTTTWTLIADQLARAFWPGPLTLVLPKNPVVPDIVTAFGPTVGLRWPAHPFPQAVIRQAGFPLAAPSANLSARTSPTTVEHVVRTLSGLVPLIVDGGPCHVGIESTVLDLTSSPPRILRPGMIHAQSLSAVIGPVDGPGSLRSGHPLPSPGLLPRHYAPIAPLKTLAWTDDNDLRRQLGLSHPLHPSEPPHRPSRICVITHTHIPSPAGFHRVSVIPHEPDAFARALYAELHTCDTEAADLIVVETVPPLPEWTAIADRLRRAQA